MAAMDRVLVALWIRGFKIVSLDNNAVIERAGRAVSAKLGSFRTLA